MGFLPSAEGVDIGLMVGPAVDLEGRCCQRSLPEGCVNSAILGDQFVFEACWELVVYQVRLGVTERH